MEFLLKGAISKDNHAKTWYIFAHCVIQMPKATTTPLNCAIFQKSFKDFYEYIIWTPNETRASKKYPLPWSSNLFERQTIFRNIKRFCVQRNIPPKRYKIFYILCNIRKSMHVFEFFISSKFTFPLYEYPRVVR